MMSVMELVLLRATKNPPQRAGLVGGGFAWLLEVLHRRGEVDFGFLVRHHAQHENGNLTGPKHSDFTNEVPGVGVDHGVSENDVLHSIDKECLVGGEDRHSRTPYGQYASSVKSAGMPSSNGAVPSFMSQDTAIVSSIHDMPAETSAIVWSDVSM